MGRCRLECQLELLWKGHHKHTRVKRLMARFVDDKTDHSSLSVSAGHKVDVCVGKCTRMRVYVHACDRGGFVEKQQWEIANDGPRDGHALLLPPRQLAAPRPTVRRVPAQRVAPSIGSRVGVMWGTSRFRVVRMILAGQSER